MSTTIPSVPSDDVRPRRAAADPGLLAARLRQLRTPRRRLVIGIAGPPGSGKSTLAAHVTAALNTAEPGVAVVVPFDGFHLSNAVLADLGRSARKGAMDTFDLAGYRALLERLVVRRDEVVYAPAYLRSIEEAVAGAIAVPAATEVVITEGNYLLVQDVELAAVRALLDETWYLDIDGDLRLQRLVDRHIQAGKTPDQARLWATGSDERNAALIRDSKHRADLTLARG